MVSLSIHTRCVAIEKAYKIQSIVFSFWKMSLNIVGSALTDSKIKYLRVDGDMSAKKRNSTLLDFQNKSACRVLLMTFSTGATGFVFHPQSSALITQTKRFHQAQWPHSRKQGPPPRTSMEPCGREPGDRASSPPGPAARGNDYSLQC